MPRTSPENCQFMDSENDCCVDCCMDCIVDIRFNSSILSDTQLDEPSEIYFGTIPSGLKIQVPHIDNMLEKKKRYMNISNKRHSYKNFDEIPLEYEKTEISKRWVEFLGIVTNLNFVELENKYVELDQIESSGENKKNIELTVPLWWSKKQHDKYSDILEFLGISYCEVKYHKYSVFILCGHVDNLIMSKQLGNEIIGNTQTGFSDKKETMMANMFVNKFYIPNMLTPMKEFLMNLYGEYKLLINNDGIKFWIHEGNIHEHFELLNLGINKKFNSKYTH